MTAIHAIVTGLAARIELVGHKLYIVRQETVVGLLDQIEKGC